MEAREKKMQVGTQKRQFGRDWKNWFQQNRELTIFLLWAVIWLLAKIVMMNKIHIYALTTAVADDALMVRMAENWGELHWLGGYNQYTLVKGIFFPAFLEVGHFRELITYRGFRFFTQCRVCCF